MLRMATYLFAAASVLLLGLGDDAEAAGARHPAGIKPPTHRLAVSGSEGPPWVRRGVSSGPEERRFGHRRGRWGGPGLYGPGYYPGLGSSQAVLLGDQPRDRAYDPSSFANLPVSIGIPNPPTPDPTLYRIEGRRDRPVTRVIRIAEAQSQGTRHGRYIHAETGALLLRVPGR